MKATLLIAAAAVTVMGISIEDSHACGDKFLVLGRGARYQEQLYQIPANILVYANTTLDNSAVSDLDLEHALVSGGHTYLVVSDMEQLQEKVDSFLYDIVLVDVRDADLVQEALLRKAADLAVLPVVYKEDKDVLAEAKSKYDSVLKAPARNRYLLAVIDDTMAKRTRKGEEGTEQ